MSKPFYDGDPFSGVDGITFNEALMNEVAKQHQEQLTEYQLELERAAAYDQYWRTHFKPGERVLMMEAEPELPPTSTERYPFFALEYLNTH